MRFARGDVRDHIVSSKIDHGSPLVALKSDAAAEKRKDQLSRDFLGRSVFDLCNNIGTYRTYAHVRVESEMRRITDFCAGEIDEHAPLAGPQSEGVICPTGCQAICLSSPFCKNIFVFA